MCDTSPYLLNTDCHVQYMYFCLSVSCVCVQNLPFDINNRVKLTLWFILYFGSGFAVPFIALRHQLLKA